MKSKILNSLHIVVTIMFALWLSVYVLADRKRDKASSEKCLEIGYFQGQKDAMHGDVRIIQVKDTLNDTVTWTWVKSPWCDGRKPVYVPK